MLLCLWAAANPAAADERYGLQYVVTIGDGDHARVALRVDQQSRELRTLRFVSPSARFSHFDADEGLQRDGDDWAWRVGPDGGEIRWRAKLESRRADGSVDAMRGKDWLLIRTEDLIPPIASRTTVGAAARTTLRFELPSGWSIVTGYGETDGVASTIRTAGSSPATSACATTGSPTRRSPWPRPASSRRGASTSWPS